MPVFFQTPLLLYWVDAAPQASNTEEETIQQNRHLCSVYAIATFQTNDEIQLHPTSSVDF